MGGKFFIKFYETVFLSLVGGVSKPFAVNECEIETGESHQMCDGENLGIGIKSVICDPEGIHNLFLVAKLIVAECNVKKKSENY